MSIQSTQYSEVMTMGKKEIQELKRTIANHERRLKALEDFIDKHYSQIRIKQKFEAQQE